MPKWPTGRVTLASIMLHCVRIAVRSPTMQWFVSARPSLTAMKSFQLKITIPGMRNLFDKLEAKTQSNMSKADKKRFNALVGNALDLKLDYKIHHASSKLKLIKDNEKFLYFEYYDKIYPTVHAFNKSVFKYVTLDSGAIGPLTRGADVMCPGVIKYKDMCSRFEQGEVVGIEIPGQGIFAVGVSIMSYDEMISKKEGPVIDVLHVKGDSLDLGRI